MAKPARSASRGNARFNPSMVTGTSNPYLGRMASSQSAVGPQARPRAESSQDAWKRQVADCLKASGMTRADFLKMAGVTAGAVAATGMGLGGVARAQVPPAMGPVTSNPDPVHIKKPGYYPENGEMGAADGTESEMWVFPAGTADRRTLLEAGRLQDYRISIADLQSAVFNPDNGYFLSIQPLSETSGLDQSVTWDTRKRTIDAMNVEWAANNVAKKSDGNPGQVVLKNIPGKYFEFGHPAYIPGQLVEEPPGCGVIICNDCVITGEGTGTNLTTIRNGSAAFVVNWSLGYLFYQWGWPLGPQAWHAGAENVTLKDFVLQDGYYPNVLAYDSLDLSAYIPEIDWWATLTLASVEVNNVNVINAKTQPELATSIPILVESGGSAKINNCFVSMAQGNFGFSIGTAVGGPSRLEITNNEIDASACPGSTGIDAGVFHPDGSGTVAGNIINADGLGVFLGGFNTTLQGNDYTQCASLTGWVVDMNYKWAHSGCVMLDVGSSGNTVNETMFPAGSVCTQVADLSIYNANPNIVHDNTVVGLDQCNLGIYFNLMQKIKQTRDYQALKERLGMMRMFQQGPGPYGKIPGWPKDL